MLICKVMTRFLPMVDGLRERGKLIKQKGFEVPEIETEMVSYFCEDDTILELEHKYDILISKNAVSQGDYQADYINNLFIKGRKEMEITGEAWHATPSPFWQRFIKSESTNFRQHQEVIERFQKKKKVAWSKEVNHFSTDEYKAYNEDKVSSWIKLVEDVSYKCAIEHKFERRKTLSNKQKIYLLKPVYGKWSIYISIDLFHFKNRLHPNNIVRNIEVLFGLIFLDSSRRKIDNVDTIKSVLSFKSFFPISRVFEDYLKSFDTLQELEALIKMYFILYGIISEEFECIALESVQYSV